MCALSTTYLQWLARDRRRHVKLRRVVSVCAVSCVRRAAARAALVAGGVSIRLLLAGVCVRPPSQPKTLLYTDYIPAFPPTEPGVAAPPAPRRQSVGGGGPPPCVEGRGRNTAQRRAALQPLRTTLTAALDAADMRRPRQADGSASY
jgi:hypothetical protein